MEVFITDTSFWIDLHDGDIPFLPFTLPFKWAITDFALIELSNRHPDLSENIFSRGLKIETLSPELVQEIFEIIASLQTSGKKFRSISATDISSFVLARKINATLITSDAPLRKFASSHGIIVHGTLWVMEKFIDTKNLSVEHGIEVLRRILSSNSRLPVGECEKLIKKWSKLTGRRK